VAKGLAVKLLGERKVRAVFKRLSKTAQKEMQDNTVDAIHEIRTLTVRDTPVDTGRLRSSYRADIRMDKLGGTVASNVEYARPVEFGSKPHIIRPKTAKVLRWSTGKGRPAAYARFVRHPGTAAQPHLKPAFLKVAPEYLRKIPGALRTALRRARR
jgi:hypothetical protein